MSNDDTDADLEVEIETFEEPTSSTQPAGTSAGTLLGGQERPSCHLIAFAAGRGGTGRSLIAANVAIYLAQAGKKVVAIDADPAGGPLHQLLGANRPPRGFGDLVRGKASGLGELIVDTP